METVNLEASQMSFGEESQLNVGADIPDFERFCYSSAEIFSECKFFKILHFWLFINSNLLYKIRKTVD